MDNKLYSEGREQIQEIQDIISWREFTKHYFGKSSSWLYHKLDGITGAQKAGGFTMTEKEQFKNSLLDLSERIKNVANGI